MTSQDVGDYATAIIMKRNRANELGKVRGLVAIAIPDCPGQV